MGKNLCEGASWCLLKPIEGSHACRVHTELPVKKFFNTEGGLVSVEEPDKWRSRYKAFKDRLKKAAEKQAESDAAMGKRR